MSEYDQGYQYAKSCNYVKYFSVEQLQDDCRVFKAMAQPWFAGQAQAFREEIERRELVGVAV